MKWGPASVSGLVRNTWPSWSMKASFLLILSALFVSCNWPISVSAQEAVRKPTRTPIYTKEGTESCLLCHSGEKIRAIASSPHLDMQIPGSPALAHGCESCHGPGSIHISRAHGGKGFPLLTRFGRGKSNSPREEQLNACLSCHADESMGDTRIVFVGSAHDRPNINCSNCHDMHAQTDQMSDQDTQTKTCNKCHRGDIKRHPRFEDKSIDFDALSCSACHDVHAPLMSEDQSSGHD